MIFEETILKGAFLICPEHNEDERGFFARTFCVNEFAKYSLNSLFVQSSISFNKKKGTFRGVHMQTTPYAEDKLVTCTQGAILDYIVDLRPNSKTFKKWISIELSAENRHMLYIPKLMAHAYLTLEDETQVLYQMTEFYHPECAWGFRWNDKAFNLKIDSHVRVISERDMNYKDFDLTFTNTHWLQDAHPRQRDKL